MSHVDMMEYPYGAFLKIRLEFVLLRDDDLQARIMSIIEGWMIDQKKVWLNECAEAASNNKPEPPEPDYYVTLSYAQIMAQLYKFNSSRKGEGKEVVEEKKNTISRNTLSKAIQALVGDQYLLTRPNHHQGREFDAAQYVLNRPLIQAHMRLLPKNPLSYLGSNGRIDSIPCHDFFNPPKEIPCTKFVHGGCTNFGGGDAQKTCVPCTNFGGGDAQKTGILIDNIIDFVNRNTNRDNVAQSADASAPTPPSLDSLTNEQLLEILRQRGIAVTAITAITAECNSFVDTPAVNAPVVNERQEKAQRNTNSYSQQEEQKTSKGRKPRTDKSVNPATEETIKVTRDQIKKAYEIISKAKAELYSDPDYIEVENKRSTESIKNLIKAKGTPAMLSLVIHDMWNECGDDGIHWWRENKRRMSVTAICNQYANRASEIKKKLARQQSLPSQLSAQSQQSVAPASISVPSIGDNSCRPELKRYVPDMPLPTTQWHNPNKRTPRLAVQGGTC